MMMLMRLVLCITCKINFCGQTDYLVFLGTTWYFFGPKGPKIPSDIFAQPYLTPAMKAKKWKRASGKKTSISTQEFVEDVPGFDLLNAPAFSTRNLK